MHVTIERTKEEREDIIAKDVAQLLQKLALNPQTVLVARNGTLVTEDEPLEKDDRIIIMSVVSGG